MTHAPNSNPVRSEDTAHPRGALFDRMRRTFSAFAANARGNVAMMFGLSIIPLLAATGAAVDYTRASTVQQKLGLALDSAALAVGSSLETDTQELEAIARKYFEANYPELATEVGGSLSVIITQSTITISATANVPTSIVRVVGIDTVPVHATTEVTKETKGTEVVLVLDNTGSMNSSGKITALKSAAAELVEIAFGGQETPELLKFGLVPFSAAVNVGADKLTSGWIDTNALSSFHSVNFASTSNVFSLYNDLQDKSWNGCVQARPAPYDTTDTAPTSSDGDTLWVPYFAPDEPDYSAAQDAGYWYGNSYVGDETTSTNLDMDYRQKKVTKYPGEWVGSSAGPHFNCQIAPITALTNQKQTLLNSINAMVATGSTVIPMGLAWGWRVLSPGEPFTEGVAYSNEDYNKVIILLTDGKNDVGSNQNALPNPNLSWYSGYGYVAQGRLGTTNMSSAHTELDARTAQLCANIKNEDILIFTITFQLSDGPIKDLMRDCATDPEKYFDSPDNATLQQHFQAIGKELRNLRISG